VVFVALRGLHIFARQVKRVFSAADLIHRDVIASRTYITSYKLMHECALFDLASALTSTYFLVR
jgi:hypothetical protein